MTTITNNKTTRMAQKKDLHQQNIQTLNQLALRPNITIKKKVIIKNANTQQTTGNITNSQNKVTNSKNMVTNSQNMVTNSRNMVTNSRIMVTNSQKLVVEKAATSSKNMVKKKVGLMEKLQLIKNAEFYPDRGKRNVKGKKIKLQPKHDYKIVATTNKRKRRIPRKGIESSPVMQSPTVLESPGVEELSLSALVRLAEEQGLDDEDFMEILTCPSPVWWEDSSDDDLSHEDIDEEATEKLQNTQNINNKTITDTNGNKIPFKNNKTSRNLNFKKFGSKRSKLESILGNIKHKKTKAEHNTNKEYAICIEQNIDGFRGNINDMEQHIHNIEEDLNYIVENVNDMEEATINSEFRGRKRSNSLGCLSDVSINEEEFLDTLENLEIPVKDINELDDVKNEITHDIIMPKIRNKAIENNGMNLKYGNKRKRTRKPRNNNGFKLQDKTYIVKENNEIAIKDETKDPDLDIIPTDLPPLTKNPFKNIPKSIGSPTSVESETISMTELDSISDTNIKFLDEYDDKKKPIEAVSVNKYGKGKDGELVTVYQILTNNKTDCMDLDIEQQIKVNLVNKSPQTSTEVNKNNGEINSFYKTRKSAYRCRSKYKKH